MVPAAHSGRRLATDDRGTAAVEFALWCTLFFLTITVALDFGLFYVKRGAINEAIGAVAVSSFETRETVPFNQIPSFVQALSDEPDLVIDIRCNGQPGCVNDERTCACMKGDGTFVPLACGTACTAAGTTAGSTAGYYLTISARQSYQPVLVPGSTALPAEIAQHTTVRLQ